MTRGTTDSYVGIWRRLESQGRIAIRSCKCSLIWFSSQNGRNDDLPRYIEKDELFFFWYWCRSRANQSPSRRGLPYSGNTASLQLCCEAYPSFVVVV